MSRWRTHSRAGTRLVASGAAFSLVATASVAGGAQAAPADGETLPVYSVVQEGLVPDQAAELADQFDIPNALEPAGAFRHVDPESFQQVPLETVGEGEDESGNPTQTQALDQDALADVEPIPADEALALGDELLDAALLSEDMAADGQTSHAELALSDPEGEAVEEHLLDTSVSYDLSLAGLPVTGQGAKLRVTFAPDGSVSQLSHSLREVEHAGEVPVISSDEAREACAALYPEGVAQDEPTLGYHFPELTATEANGEGSVEAVYPQYTCQPAGDEVGQAHRRVSAVPDAAPSGAMSATRDGEAIEAEVSVSGGTEPYSYSWSSSTTVLPQEAQGGPAVAYERDPRGETEQESVTVEVTDANGLSATASVALDGDGGADAATTPGGGGFGVLTLDRTDVGIEQTVDEWQCAEASADGFRDVMASEGVATQFDWRGHGAWERDFKDPSRGGWDHRYVDDVDAAWYTGHGWPSGFTFKSSRDDHWIVPGDARWGNRDLEWLQLESCQVLRDTDGSADYFDRWREVFDGLHMLNGFDTNAYCVGGGTGARFAQYLFPQEFLWWTIRPALPVRKAWASMAIDKEPNGVVYRSMGTYRWTDGASNIGDYFWGEGPVGPDIPIDAPGVGMWSIKGTV